MVKNVTNIKSSALFIIFKFQTKNFNYAFNVYKIFIRCEMETNNYYGKRSFKSHINSYQIY